MGSGRAVGAAAARALPSSYSRRTYASTPSNQLRHFCRVAASARLGSTAEVFACLMRWRSQNLRTYSFDTLKSAPLAE